MSKSDSDIEESIEKMLCNNDMLLLSLGKFYSTKNNVMQLINIVEGTYSISLRLIDWFVTNYSKKNNTVIIKCVNNDVIHFNVYLSYRSQLKAYSKQQFDPFRRRDRMNFYFEKDKYVETTVGQLNFFRWVIQNDILDYIEKNSTDIEEDMIKTQKENQKKRMCSTNLNIKVLPNVDGQPMYHTRKKRNELSKSSMKNMNVMNGAMTIKFD
jgi:hypothetical protein